MTPERRARDDRDDVTVTVRGSLIGVAIVVAASLALIVVAVVIAAIVAAP